MFCCPDQQTRPWSIRTSNWRIQDRARENSDLSSSRDQQGLLATWKTALRTSNWTSRIAVRDTRQGGRGVWIYGSRVQQTCRPCNRQRKGLAIGKTQIGQGTPGGGNLDLSGSRCGMQVFVGHRCQQLEIQNRSARAGEILCFDDWLGKEYCAEKISKHDFSSLSYLSSEGSVARRDSHSPLRGKAYILSKRLK